MPKSRFTVSVQMVASIVLALVISQATYAAVFHCSSGDVDCLIDSINTANANGEENTIILEAGIYSLTAVNNTGGGGPNGLPLVISTLTIKGAGAETTIIERKASAPLFRLLFIRASGNLTLEGLSLRGGEGQGVGGALWNDGGTVTIVKSTLAGNRTVFSGGGIFSGNTRGTVNIINSTLADNIVTLGEGGGIFNLGTLIITNSTLSGNSAGSFGGGISNHSAFGAGGMLTMTNSTLAGNTAATLSAKGGGLYNDGGTVTITNSTLADNTAPRGSTGGLVNVFLGTVGLQNTILARNAMGLFDNSSDCSGPITSLGNNLLGNPTGCTIILLPSDLTGDAGLGPFTDDGTPGHGHFPPAPWQPGD